jgi:type VI secretion system secreted protein VgrG
MQYTQQNRLISITTPLGKDVLLLQSFTGHEGISRLFNFELDLLSEDPAISFEAIVGQKVTISIKLIDGNERYLNGFVSRFAQSGSDERFTHYQAEVVPWLCFLTRTADCRIFQNMTVPDIITKIFSDLGFNDFQNSLQGSYEPREYCVQYRETDFNFVSRLMEQYGIFYFFKHEKSKHTLVLADSKSAHQPCPGQAKATYEHASGAFQKEDQIGSWHIEQQIGPGKYALSDYNFETPSTSLAVKVPSTMNVGGNGKYEIFDYPGEYAKKAQGESLAKIRMEEEETPNLVVTGGGNCRAFCAGHRFDLAEHYRQDMNKSYLLTEVHHVASVGGSYTDGGGGDASSSYSNRFVCIPHSVPYRPRRVTPKPIIQGVQTAVVVGPSGEEIWVDKYGRVKVQFHWDREGKKDEKSSCWIRVSQNWAGKRWGAMFIPRIGQEVIVSFLEGDPDQPLITGSVYNAEQVVPYDLPKEQTKSTMKSDSSKGHGGFNELRFEDKKGSEQIFLHAQKDVDVRVKNDSREWIGKDRHLIVKGKQKELVEGDKHLNVKMNHTEKVGQVLSIKAGQKVVIEAGMEISLKAGGGFIDIGPAGIYISGTMVYINSGGSAGSPTDPEAPDVADDGTKGGKM